MADARRAEDAFFSSKPEYREVASQCGIANLARRLNVLLVEHIRAMLPVSVCVSVSASVQVCLHICG